MHASLIKFCCLLFVLQGMFSNIVSGHNLRTLNAQSDADVLVICTGNETKWISAQQYFDFGKIVEIQAPADADESRLSLACANAHAFENKLGSHMSTWLLSAWHSSSEDRFQTLYSSPLPQPFYLLASSRAPPQVLNS